MSSKIIYLAGPYYHENPIIRELRFEQLTDYAAKLMKQGKVVYSPITHCHPMAVRNNMPKDWEFWQNIDTQFLAVCSSMIVLCLDEWEMSRGVNAEIKIAKSLNIPVEFVEIKNKERI